MEAHELAENYRNSRKTRELHEKVVQWCSENVDKLDMSNKDHKFLFDIGTRYLLKIKLGTWNKEDAKVAIHYLAKKTASEIGINENITVKILEKEQYEKEHGKSIAICVSNEDTSSISYSPRVINQLTSDNKDEFLRGMQTIFHEVMHAEQNTVIRNQSIEGVKMPKTKVIYFMALETIVHSISQKFYDDNYLNLIKENHAEKIGLKKAMQTIKEYCQPSIYGLYSQEEITKRIEEYDSKFYNAIVMTKDGKTYDIRRSIDTLSCEYISTHPEIIKKYPILEVGYNLDGTKKDIVQLIEDRNTVLQEGENAQVVNELYESVANHRNVLNGGLKGITVEMEALKVYIEQTGTEDEFIFDLLKYRLENKTKASPEAKKKYMEQVYATAAKTRRERQEQEIKHEKTESIRDEIGDEFQHKTEAQEQEEQQVEAMWQNRFQSWDRNTINLPNGAKRKEEAVKVIQDIEKEIQTQVEKKEQQSENEQR